MKKAIFIFLGLVVVLNVKAQYTYWNLDINNEAIKITCKECGEEIPISESNMIIIEYPCEYGGIIKFKYICGFCDTEHE